MLYLINIDSVTPYVYFVTANKKRQCYPSCFIWIKRQCYPLCFNWQISTVLPFMFFFMTTNKKTTVLPLMFLFMTTNKKTTVLPLMFFFMTTNKKQQCYPLRFFSWRPIKNDSVTLYVLFDKYRKFYPLCLFHDGR